MPDGKQSSSASVARGRQDNATNSASSGSGLPKGQRYDVQDSTDDESEYHEAENHFGKESGQEEAAAEIIRTSIESGKEQIDNLSFQDPGSSAIEDRPSSPNHPASESSRPSASTHPLSRVNSSGSGKEKKKAVSFLSRFLSTNKIKRSSTLSLPNDRSIIENDRSSINSLSRQETMEGPIFSQDIDNIEFSPRIPQPTSYFKVKSKNKRDREFDRLFLAQELQWHLNSPKSTQTKPGKGEKQDQDAIWAIAFSLDGRYLAVGGENHVVKVWSVLASEEEREAQYAEDGTHSSNGIQMRASVFKSAPLKTYTDHEGAILDLCWSKNHFLLTTSQDRTIRLFHPSRPECLCTFKHSAPVLSIAFHPKDDRFFLAGCKDAKLRLWSIPDKRIEFWVNVGDMITAVGFSPDGKTSLAGTVSGMISLYSTENLKSVGQIAVRGKKKTRITGIDTKCVPATSDALKVLVTTSDSRVRLYNLRDKALELKLKAHKNDELPIRASINDDGRYAICGSEDKGVYIWSLADTNLLPASDRERDKTIQRPLEYFEANSSKTTCAIIAPQETRIFLGQSGDPIYDICNPPPVRLVEREGSVASSTKWNGSASSVNGNGNGNGNGKSQPRSQPAGPSGSPKPELRGGSDTPGTAHSATFHVDNAAAKSSYQARSLHDDGLIIVTASIAGIIRVFRQDCAFRKRKSFDMSIYQSSSRAYLRRALGSSRASISGPPSSARQSSISSYKAHHQPTPSIKGIAGGTVVPLAPLSSQRPDGGRLGTGELTVRAKSRSESISSQPSRDRIERWREDVDGLGASSTSLRRAGSVASTSTTRTNNSPSKQQHHLVSAAGLTMSAASGSGNTPRSSPRKGKTVSLRQVVGETPTVALDDASSLGRKGSDSETLDRQDLARRSSSYANPLRLQGGQSFMFWNMGQYDQKDNTVEAHDLESDDVDLGPSHTRPSLVSRLTDDSKEDDEDDDDDSDLEGGTGSSNGKCPRCGGMDMKTKESRSWGFGKSRSIVCEGCGLERRHGG